MRRALTNAWEPVSVCRARSPCVNPLPSAARLPLGFFVKPSYVPEHFSQTFTPVQREAVLAHELAHLALNDPACNFSPILSRHFSGGIRWSGWRDGNCTPPVKTRLTKPRSWWSDGATTFAECLVDFARQFTSPGAFGWMSIEGNGFRSNLARRVERLLTLQNTEWRLPGSPAVLALKVFVPILLVALAIVSYAVAQRDRTQPGSSA